MPMATQCPPGTDYAAWAAATAKLQMRSVYQRVVENLAPLIRNNADKDDWPLACSMAMRAIASYLPETDADWFSASDIVSFSLTATDLLNDARNPDLSPAMKLRFVGRAIQASRTARQTEAALTRRRKERNAMDAQSLQRVTDLRNLEPHTPHPPPNPAPEENQAPTEYHAPAEHHAPTENQTMAAALQQAFAEMAAEIRREAQQAETIQAETIQAETQPEAPTPDPKHTHPNPAPVAAATPARETTAPEKVAPWYRATNPDGSPAPDPGYPITAHAQQRQREQESRRANQKRQAG